MPHQPFQPTPHTFNTADFAVVAALLDYYGLPYSLRSLNDYLHHHSFGSLMTEMADCLLQHGLETTLVNAQPTLFSRQIWNSLFLQDYPKTDENKLPTTNEVERVIAKGVFLQRLLPSIKIIDKELENDRPVIISYNPALIDSLQPQGVSQGIVTYGDDTHYLLFEPSYDNRITQQEKQVVLYAINEVSSPDPTASSIILGKEKTPAPTAPPGPLPEI
jgi:hypothetical protein